MFRMKVVKEVSTQTPIDTTEIKLNELGSTAHANKKNASFSSLSLCGDCNYWVKEEHYARKHPLKRTKKAKKKYREIGHGSRVGKPLSQCP
jgi:hypothetical protein